MDENLKRETENLILSWANNNHAKMKEYLVTGFENPRINMQSIITRHFFIKELFGNRFDKLMEEEILFSIDIHKTLKAEEDKRTQKDIKTTTQSPRYSRWKALESIISEEKWDRYMKIWSNVLKPLKKNLGNKISKLSVLEVACGSANDYRFLSLYGIADFLDYTGIDITEVNIENSKKMFPNVDFRIGNALEIDAKDNSYEYLLVSDLLEHLSLNGLETAIKEICRVTANKLLVHFFSMQDIKEHKINPKKRYHWNWLSQAKTQKLFENYCKVNANVCIKEKCNTDYNYMDYYNKNAHTFFLEKLQ
jgi:ubiquinone/menaquinone biosynthesis C-methylase UbiE